MDQQTDANGSNTDADLRQAMSLHEHGRLDEADVLYAKVIAAAPDHLQALRLRGILARQRGDLTASITCLQMAVEMAPDDAAALNELALSHMAAGDLHAGEAALRDTLDIEPDSRRALANLGALLQRCGHVTEAIELYERYLKLEPGDLEVRSNLANALMDAGQAEAALAACDAALLMAPGHPLLLANKGAVLSGLERYASAVEVFDLALASNPNDDLALLNLGYAQRALGRTDAALDALTRAARLGPDNARAAGDLANVLVETGEIGRALEVCEHFLTEHPGERLVLAMYACALRDAGRNDEAARILDYASLVRTIDIEVPDGYADLAEFNEALGHFVIGHSSLLRDPMRKATTGGAQTGELNPGEDRVIEALDGVLRSSVRQVISGLLAEGFGDHEVMAYASDAWSLRTWGTVLDGGGGQSPHQHPLGWLSGVYYVRLPEAITSATDGAGQLEFGRLPERIQATTEPVIFPVTPREGRLVIFPSWFYHSTRQFDADEPRVSIAFDVMPNVGWHASE